MTENHGEGKGNQISPSHLEEKVREIEVSDTSLSSSGSDRTLLVTTFQTATVAHVSDLYGQGCMLSQKQSDANVLIDTYDSFISQIIHGNI